MTSESHTDSISPARTPSMKAIRVHQYGGPQALQYEDASIPEPQSGQVRLCLKAIGVNFIDTYHRSGAYAMQLPFIPGVEGAGIIEAVGPDVDPQCLGQRVAFVMQTGAYAQYVVVPANQLIPIPDTISFDQAAACLLQGMTAHFLAYDLGPTKSGEPVMVHAGAGGLGQLLIQLLKHRGMTVFTTVSTPEKAEIVRKLGADEVINYAQTDFVAKVLQRNHSTGVAVTYDSVGATTWRGSIEVTRPRGLVVLCGQSSGPVPPIDPQMLRAQGSLILTRPSLGDYITQPQERYDRASTIFSLLASGALVQRLDSILPLSHAATAHEKLETRANRGKILLRP